nr:transcription factor PCF7-like [Ipomoea trifida]
MNIQQPLLLGPRLVLGEAVGDGLETEAGVAAAEMGAEVGVAEEAFVVVEGVDEGDVEAAEAEKLGEVEHGSYVALEWEWEEEDVRGKLRCKLFGHGVGEVYWGARNHRHKESPLQNHHHNHHPLLHGRIGETPSPPLLSKKRAFAEEKVVEHAKLEENMGENQNQNQRSWSRLGVVRNAVFAGGREIVEVRGDDHIVWSMGRKDRHSKVCTATAAFVSEMVLRRNSILRRTASRNNHNGFEMVLTLTLRWMNLTDTSPRCKHYRRRCKHYRRRCKIRDYHNEAKVSQSYKEIRQRLEDNYWESGTLIKFISIL